MKNITKISIPFVWVAVIVFSLSSCSHYYYLPNIQNVPLFREKNEFRGNVAMGGELDLGSMSSGVEVQSAYSITDHLALQSNFMSVNVSGPKGNWGSGKYLEGAFGYYMPIKKHAVFEIYGGFGRSRQFHHYDSAYYGSAYQLAKSELTFAKYFVQPSVGLTFNGFDVALSSRFSRVNFSNINYESFHSGGRLLPEIEAIMANKMFYCIEPAITVRAGWKYVKLQLQYVGIGYVSDKFCKSQETHFTLGVFISVAERFNNRNL